MKKFELTAESKINWFGRTLFRIKACIDFTCTDGYEVHAGDLGGYIEKEQNLSHDGKAWVCGDAEVWGNAKVCGDAKVWGNAEVWGNAKVWGDASLSSPEHIFNVTPIGEGANSLTLFRTKNHEISISFEWDLYSISGFLSYIADWNEKQKKVAQLALELAKVHIDLSDNTEELKPCPFCGEDASLVELDNDNFGVTCNECNANIGQFTDKMDACKAWNTRTDD